MLVISLFVFIPLFALQLEFTGPKHTTNSFVTLDETCILVMSYNQSYRLF